MSLAFWGEHERYFHHNHSHGPVSFHRELRTSSGTTRRAYATRLTQVGRFLAHATQIPSAFVALAGGVVAPPLEHISSPRQTMRVIPVHSIAECLFRPLVGVAVDTCPTNKRMPWRVHPEREPRFPRDRRSRFSVYT